MNKTMRILVPLAVVSLADAFAVPMQRQRSVSPSSLFFRKILARKKGEDSAATSFRSESEAPDKKIKGSGSNPGRKRKPAFPAKTYPLIKDEEGLTHDFISFIDQSIFSSYSQTVRLVEPRNYARPEQFLKENRDIDPTIDDVAEPKSFYGKVATFLAWNGLPARFIVGGMSYLSFPIIIRFLENATTDVSNDNLISLVNTFLPGISIVLGTYFSLTISILYDRFTKLQELLILEAGLLAFTCNNLVHLFHDNQEAAVQGAQCICDQIRTLVFDSRGKETMTVIYNDPYARILQLLQEHDDDEAYEGQQLGNLHGAVTDLFTLRSKRMSYEALALAPTHFDVLTFLCGMLLIGFALGTVATAQTDGCPIELSRILFASLVVCYTIFYEMAFDLNRPFDGIYQVRRSGAAMHFLQVKRLVCSHPLLAGRVDFEEVQDEQPILVPDCDGNCEQKKAEVWYN